MWVVWHLLNGNNIIMSHEASAAKQKINRQDSTLGLDRKTKFSCLWYMYVPRWNYNSMPPPPPPPKYTSIPWEPDQGEGVQVVLALFPACLDYMKPSPTSLSVDCNGIQRVSQRKTSVWRVQYPQRCWWVWFDLAAHVDSLGWFDSDRHTSIPEVQVPVWYGKSHSFSWEPQHLQYQLQLTVVPERMGYVHVLYIRKSKGKLTLNCDWRVILHHHIIWCRVTMWQQVMESISDS